MTRPTSSPFAEGVGPAMLYVGFRAGAFLAEHFPMRAADSLARTGGRVAYRLAKKKRAIVTKNMRRVVGEGPHLQGVVRAAFVSYAEYWLETFRLGRYSRSDLLQIVDADEESMAAVSESLASGRGVVLATGHIGFYDLGVAWVGANGWPFTTVAEVLRPRALFEWFAAIRERNGMHVIPAKPGAVARERLAELIEAGEGVAILADRDIGRRGVWGELFGERTTFPAGPSVLTVRTNASLIGGAIYKVGTRFEVIFRKIPYELTGDDERDINSIAASIAACLESLIERHPEQWHLFSTNWPSDEPHLPPRGRVQETS